VVQSGAIQTKIQIQEQRGSSHGARLGETLRQKNAYELYPFSPVVYSCSCANALKLGLGALKTAKGCLRRSLGVRPAVLLRPLGKSLHMNFNISGLFLWLWAFIKAARWTCKTAKCGLLAERRKIP